MAPRANWKGFLRLSLVTCPVALYPATSDAEKVSFNQINKKTGHRIRYMRVDADTGEEVANEDIVKGYPVDRDTYIEVTKEELENIALESTRTIEIDEFVSKDDIDPRYIIRPYYLVPDGKVSTCCAPGAARCNWSCRTSGRRPDDGCVAVGMAASFCSREREVRNFMAASLPDLFVPRGVLIFAGRPAGWRSALHGHG